MALVIGLALVFFLPLVASVLVTASATLGSTGDEHLQLSSSGSVRRLGVSRRRQLTRAEEPQKESKDLRVAASLTASAGRHAAPFFSPLQLVAEVSAVPSESDNPFPWSVLPLCQFNEDRNFSSLVRVFVNTDNTRAFVFDRDSKGAQTKVMCHGATPGTCLTPRLSSSGVPESCASLKCECKQVTLARENILLNYVRLMLDKVGTLCLLDGGANILNIGLGGGAMPAYLLDNCASGTQVTSVERDARIITMAENFFGFQTEAGKNEVENLDAGAALQKHAKAGDRYDAILVDCFESHGVVPASCRSREFVEGVRKILKPSGMVIQQVWASQYSDLYHIYNDVFGQAQLSAEPVDAGMNYLVIARARE